MRAARLYAAVLTVLGAAVVVETAVVAGVGLYPGYLIGLALAGIGVVRWRELGRRQVS